MIFKYWIGIEMILKYWIGKEMISQENVKLCYFRHLIKTSLNEIKLTRFALPYDYTCYADGTSFEYIYKN